MAKSRRKPVVPDIPRVIPPPPRHEPPTKPNPPGIQMVRNDQTKIKPLIGPPEPWPRSMPTKAAKARQRRLRLLDVSDRVCRLENKVIILAVLLGLVALLAIAAALQLSHFPIHGASL